MYSLSIIIQDYLDRKCEKAKFRGRIPIVGISTEFDLPWCDLILNKLSEFPPI